MLIVITRQIRGFKWGQGSLRSIFITSRYVVCDVFKYPTLHAYLSRKFNNNGEVQPTDIS